MYSSTLRLILRPELALEAGQLVVHRIEDALVLAQPRFARRRARCCRCRRTASRTPRAGCIPSAAAASGSATRSCACRRSSGCRCRRRRWPARPSRARARRAASRFANCRASSWSIETSAMISTSFRAAARRAGQERSGRAGVNVVPVRLEAGEHQHLVAERRQRLEDRRELEVAALALRRPVLHRHAVRHVEGLEPVRRLASGSARAARTPAPSLEERQRQRRADAPQHGPPRQRFRR